MYKSQLELIELLLNNPTLREYYEYESAKIKERIDARMKEHIDARMKEREVVPYIRVGKDEQLTQKEKQLERIDKAFINGMLEETEYIEIRRRVKEQQYA